MAKSKNQVYESLHQKALAAFLLKNDNKTYRQILHLLDNVKENSSIVSKIHFPSIQKGERSRGYIMYGGSPVLSPNIGNLRTQRDLSARANKVVQTYDSKYLPAITTASQELKKFTEVVKGIRDNKYATDIISAEKNKQKSGNLASELNRQFSITEGRRYTQGDILSANDAQYPVGPDISDEQLAKNLEKVRSIRSDEKERKHIQVQRRRDAYNTAPWLKPLVKSGIVTDKQLPKIAKILEKIQKNNIPFIGNALRMAVKHPLLAAGTMAFSFLKASTQATQAAAKEVSSERAASIAFGTADTRLTLAGAKLGIKGTGVDKIHHRLRHKYGEDYLGVLGNIIASAKGNTFLKEQIASAEGLSAEDVALIEFATGQRKTNIIDNTAGVVTVAEEYAKNLHARGDYLTGYTHDFIRNVIPGYYSSNHLRRMIKANEEFKEGNDKYKDAVMRPRPFGSMIKIQEAARSGMNFDSGSIGGDTNNNQSQTINVNNTVTLNGGDDVKSAVEAVTAGSVAGATKRQSILDYNAARSVA